MLDLLGILLILINSEGIGLIYTGGPFSIDTTTKEGSMISNFIDISYGDCCLQSFTLDCSPGSYTCSFIFIFVYY